MIADFTERLVEGSNLVVYDPCGQQVDNGDSLVVNDRITVTMSGSHEGLYTVTFDVVSAVDSHPTNGSFSFTSGGQPCPGEEPAAQPEQPSGGGGGGGGSSDAGGTGSGSASSSRSANGVSVASGSSAQAGGARAASTRDGRQKQDAAVSRRPGQKRPGQEDLSAVVPNVNPASASGETETIAPSVWEGIPMGVFFVGLALSMVIGAAGGKIYAGIMGWRA